MMMNSWFGLKLYARMTLFFLGISALALPLRAQKQDLTFSLGGIATQTRTFVSPTAGQLNISADKTFGADYWPRLFGSIIVGLYCEIEFAASPNRISTCAHAGSAQNVASTYVFAVLS